MKPVELCQKDVAKLDSSGPIASRARASLMHVASRFGEVMSSGSSWVVVKTDSGFDLRLEYGRGNYLFSRVYNLTVSMDFPSAGKIAPGLQLKHRSGTGPQFVPVQGQNKKDHLARISSGRAQAAATILNDAVASHITGIDVLSARTEVKGESVRLSLTPMGGSFVWVMLPPVFKSTAFPQGETGRIVDLFVAVASVAGTKRVPSGK